MIEAARSLAEALKLVVHPSRNESLASAIGVSSSRRSIKPSVRLPRQKARRLASASVLASAHAARAEDALHGAGQLSLSAQRAPTLDACEEGWQRVERIVVAAEEAAHAAERAAGAMREMVS